MQPGTRLITAVLAGLAGYGLLLAVVPRLIAAAPAEPVVSAAFAQGYNAPLAYWVALLWSLVLIGAGWHLARRSGESPPAATAGSCGRLVPLELVAVFAIFFLAYFPLFLTRQGPHIEDHGFILAMLRMACGQIPYRDFEFLYGPAMVYSLWWWAQIFGVSMKSYYSFLAVQEAVQFTLMMAVLQLTIRDRRMRFLAFVILAPFLINTLLGVNWSAMRRLLAVFALLLAATRPFDLRTNLAVGVTVGLYATYSHEYAAATLAGIGLIYAALLAGADWRRALMSGPVVAVVSLAVWAAGVYAMLGPDWPSYLEGVRRVVGIMSQGHVSFAFYWTLNSLALFGLLSLVCLVVGGALPRLHQGLAAGDLYLIGALGFALITLKSGLTRADHWHLAAGFTSIFFAVLLRLDLRAIRFEQTARRLALVLVTVASATYLFGIYGSLKRYGGDYLRGAQAVMAGKPTADVDPASFRDISVEPERGSAEPNLTGIGQYLADPSRAARPVAYYGISWFVAPRIGVCTEYYPLDALMYSEMQAPLAEYLAAHPDAFVVMARADYDRVFGSSGAASAVDDSLSAFERIASWLTSPHFTQVALEGNLVNAARDGVSGAYIRANYEVDAAAGPEGMQVLLKPKVR